ncbi:hypothetical protein Q5P01_016993 [Channa striata]|uniref:Uncharacterized protein n=1 Tax=Channa striata TaxID=64152 RepID=A0AA88SB03_CHASR|nr:hypothetical protein Q5P01_016993 [Channa striata]
MEEEKLLRREWRETASEMEAGGKDHLCGDWSPGPTAQCWLSFNPPLLPRQRRRGSRRQTAQIQRRPSTENPPSCPRLGAFGSRKGVCNALA